MKKKMSKKAVGIGAGLVAAAALGAYLLHGKKGLKRRKMVKGWMLKARGEMLEKVEQLGAVGESAYHKAAKEVAKKYSGLKHVDARELRALAEELKSSWQHVKKHAVSGAKRVVKKAKKVGRARRG